MEFCVIHTYIHGCKCNNEVSIISIHHTYKIDMIFHEVQVIIPQLKQLNAIMRFLCIIHIYITCKICILVIKYTSLNLLHPIEIC